MAAVAEAVKRYRDLLLNVLENTGRNVLEAAAAADMLLWLLW